MLKEKVVLFVDDDPEIHDLIAFELEDVFARLHHAQSANEALNVLSENKVHVIISDTDMPGMSGAELLEKLRADQVRIPFVLCSGRYRADQEGPIAEHALAYRLGKPYKIERVISIVRDLVRAQ